MNAAEQVDGADASAASAPPQDAREGFAWSSPLAHLRFWLIAISGLALDLYSKHWAFHRLDQLDDKIVVIPHVLEFELMFNTGALFGIGQGQTTLFVCASVLALTLVVAMFMRSARRRWVLHVALAAIFAGALGNMYDRMFVRLYPYPFNGRALFCKAVAVEDGMLHLVGYPPTREGARRLPPIALDEIQELDWEPVGCVRDFIKIPTRIFGERELWPWVFNVADMLLVGGVGILAIFLWRDGRHPPPEPSKPAAASSPEPPVDSADSQP